MRRLSGFILIVLICGIVAYAFSHRPPVILPDTVQQFSKVLITDASRQGQRIVAVADAGRIFVSDDGGENFRFIHVGTKAMFTRLRMLNDKLGFAVGHDAVIYKSEDGGETWTEKYADEQAESPLMDILAIDENTLVAVGAYHQYLQSDDAGQTWEPKRVSDDDKHFNAIVRIGDAGLLLLGEAGTVKFSKDKGKTWGNVDTPYKGSLFGAVVLNDTSAIAYGMRGNLMRFTVGAKSLQPIANDSKASILGGRMIGQQLVLGGQDGTLLVSDDQGESFSILRTPGNLTHTAVLPGLEGQWLALGERGAIKINAAAQASLKAAAGGSRE
jgi:photosystem II stability/assembly factor-like uncharacterized protein